MFDITAMSADLSSTASADTVTEAPGERLEQRLRQGCFDNAASAESR